jgi:exosortase/archaeosortase family protein
MITRSTLFGSLSVVGFLNGISERVVASFGDGIAAAAFATFGVSIVVWAAIATVIWFMMRAPAKKANGSDMMVAAVAAATFLVPVAFISWLGIAGIAAWLLLTVERADPMHAAAFVLASLTVPMVWARLLLAGFSNAILGADAKLISWIVGTQSRGNTIPFADGSGILLLEPACSSLTNLSLTMLCGVIFTKVYGLRFSAPVLATIGLACAATVTINVLRISAIGVLPVYYEEIHGPLGATVAQLATALVVLFIYVERLERHA